MIAQAGWNMRSEPCLCARCGKLTMLKGEESHFTPAAVPWDMECQHSAINTQLLEAERCPAQLKLNLLQYPLTSLAECVLRGPTNPALPSLVTVDLKNAAGLTMARSSSRRVSAWDSMYSLANLNSLPGRIPKQMLNKWHTKATRL